MPNAFRITIVQLLGWSFLTATGCSHSDFSQPPRQADCVVDIVADRFIVDGKPTYADRQYQGKAIDGLLLNARMVQGIFDDENPQTRRMWRAPDGREFSAEENTDRFVAAMADWREHGLIAFTLNLQGGSPQGYSKDQPWINSAFTASGQLKPAYLSRLKRILDRARELRMVPIVGLFYFGQVGQLPDESAVRTAVDQATDFLIANGYSNVLIEIANECDSSKYPAILRPDRADELIQRVQQRSAGKVNNRLGRLYVSTSFKGGAIPSSNAIRSADFILLHGNGVASPDGIRQMVRLTRSDPQYRGQPILFNEDDHFDFDKPDNHFLAALDERAGWGYFDYRMAGESFRDGFQSVPVDWSIASPRKVGFFNLLKTITGGARQ